MLHIDGRRQESGGHNLDSDELIQSCNGGVSCEENRMLKKGCSLAKHSGAIDEVLYHGYPTNRARRARKGGLPRVGSLDHGVRIINLIVHGV
jgi:hypothetical protein